MKTLKNKNKMNNIMNQWRTILYIYKKLSMLMNIKFLTL